MEYFIIGVGILNSFLLIGIAGSLLATYGGRLLGLYGENSAAGFIASVIGAIVIHTTC